MGKDKLRRWKEIKTFNNVIENEFGADCEFKGKWNSKFFKNDNPIVLELGCGEGRGIDIILKKSKSYTAIDKIKSVIDELSLKYKNNNFSASNFPPLEEIQDNSFDTIISFQVIEHINDDELFISEIKRILRPGGIALITTPNIKMTLTRNPWHIREYTSKQLRDLCEKYFS